MGGFLLERAGGTCITFNDSLTCYRLLTAKDSVVIAIDKSKLSTNRSAVQLLHHVRPHLQVFVPSLQPDSGTQNCLV